MQALIDGDVLPEDYDFYGLEGIYSRRSGRQLQGYIGANGYLYFTFYDRTRKYFHRLVCRAIYGPALGRHVNHKDGNRLNNHPDNLEWVSVSENNYHAYTLPRKKINSYRHSNTKLSDEDILAIYNSVGSEKQVALQYGTSSRTVHNIRHGYRHGRVTKGGV